MSRFLDFLIENTIMMILTIIGGIVTTVLIRRLPKDKSITSEKNQRSHDVMATECIAPARKDSRTMDSKVLEKDAVGAVDLGEMSPREISDAIDKLPPYQASELEKWYIGKLVTWTGELNSVYSRSGTFYFTINVPSAQTPSAHFVFCSIIESAAGILTKARTGEILRVRGAIAHINRYEAGLNNCTIEKM